MCHTIDVSVIVAVADVIAIVIGNIIVLLLIFGGFSIFTVALLRLGGLVVRFVLFR